MLSTISSAGTCIVQWGQRNPAPPKDPSPGQCGRSACHQGLRCILHRKKKIRSGITFKTSESHQEMGRTGLNMFKAHAILGCSLLTAGESMTIQFPQNFQVVPPAVRVKGAASAGRNQPLAVAVWRRAVAFVWKARQAGRSEDRAVFFWSAHVVVFFSDENK